MNNEKKDKLMKALEEMNKYIDIIIDISDGKTETKACDSRNVDRGKFRRTIKNITNDNDLSVNKNNYIWLSPEEKIALDTCLFEDLSDMPTNIDECIKQVIDTRLEERYRSVIHDIYWLGYTYDECGEKYGVTRERIRQIYAKALRIIRGQRKLIIRGKESYESIRAARLIKETEKIKADIAKLVAAEEDNKKYNELYEIIASKVGPETAEVLSKKEDINLLYILNTHGHTMTVRTYNCLYRAIYSSYSVTASGKSYGDVLVKDLLVGDIMRIRNFGRKSYEELTAILRQYGWEERNE